MRTKALTIAAWASTIFLALWFPARFYWDVTHYYSHFEDFLAVFCEYMGLGLCAVWIIFAIWKRKWSLLLAIAPAIASCIFFAYWIGRIPFCVECDHTVFSDLGYMLEPFADRFGQLWPE